MTQAIRAKVFMRGRSQDVTIPAEFHLRSDRVEVHRDPETGDVILSELPDVEAVFSALDTAGLPANFMSDQDRDRRP